MLAKSNLVFILFFLSFHQKVDECENLPKNMCDSCIIQLNVAYNLKKNAIQSDMKLRQYMIEFGINVTSYTTCSINTVSVIRPPAMIMPTTTTSESVTITTAKSTTVAQEPPLPPPPPRPHQPFPVMPFMIKEEPIDYEEMSDITVETHTEAFEDRMRSHRDQNGGIESTPSTSSSSNKSTTPLPQHSMVSVHRKSFMISSKRTDSEYISAYVRRPSANSNQSKNSQKKLANKKVVSSKPSPKKAKSPASPPRQNTGKNNSNDKTVPEKTNKTDAKTTSAKTNREVKSLFDDSVNKMVPLQPKRLTRQQQSGTENIHHKSRSRSGVLPVTDYKSFFFGRTASPANGTQKIGRRTSVDSIKRKANSPNPRHFAKSRNAGVNRKRSYPVPRGKTSI